jgi:transporter family protein
MWLYLGVISAIFLGLYDVGRKHALKDNAVLPVLFSSIVCSAIVAVATVILSRAVPDYMLKCGLFIPVESWTAHLHTFNKAVIISAAWVLSNFALKNLPISTASLANAASVVWVLAGGMILFHEHITVIQFIGFGVIVASYYCLSIIGNREKIILIKNKWILFILLATLLGAASAMYDKYLLQNLGYSPLFVQGWFLIYLVPIMGMVVAVFWYPVRQRHTAFVWRWSIPIIAMLLIFSDILYFRALNCTGSLISILSAVRSSYIAVSFLCGGFLLSELYLS